MKHGKKYTEAAKQVDRAVAYEPADAVALAKKTAVAKFDETIEVHIRTGCDGRHAQHDVHHSLFISEQAVMDVMLISRSVVQLYCLTELVRLLRFWYLPRVTR